VSPLLFEVLPLVELGVVLELVVELGELPLRVVRLPSGDQQAVIAAKTINVRNCLIFIIFLKF
jgi:hypothetical protein